MFYNSFKIHFQSFLKNLRNQFSLSQLAIRLPLLQLNRMIYDFIIIQF